MALAVGVWIFLFEAGSHVIQSGLDLPFHWVFTCSLV